MAQFVHDPCSLHVVLAGFQFVSEETCLGLQDLHLHMDMLEGIVVPLESFGLCLETPFIEVEECGMDMVIALVGCGEHGMKPWGQGSNGPQAKVVGVGIKLDNVCGFLLVFSSLQPHLPVIPLLNPLGQHLEPSSNRDECYCMMVYNQ